MTETLTIRLPRGLKKQLEAESRAKKVPVSDLAREALQRHAILWRFEEVRRKMVPRAEAKGIFTDEDVFEALS